MKNLLLATAAASAAVPSVQGQLVNHYEINRTVGSSIFIDLDSGQFTDSFSGSVFDSRDIVVFIDGAHAGIRGYSGWQFAGGADPLEYAGRRYVAGADVNVASPSDSIWLTQSPYTGGFSYWSDGASGYVGFKNAAGLAGWLAVTVDFDAPSMTLADFAVTTAPFGSPPLARFWNLPKRPL